MGGDTPEGRLSSACRSCPTGWCPLEEEQPQEGGSHVDVAPTAALGATWPGLSQAHVGQGGGRVRLVNVAKPQIPWEPGSRAPRRPHEVTRISEHI